MDSAYEETERILKDLEKRITKEYAEAARDIQDKLDDYLRRFAIKDKTWQKWVKTGYKTEAEYKKWRVGQMAIGQRWEDMKETIVGQLHYANEMAKALSKGEMPNVYMVNHDYGVYEVEHGTNINTSYTMYDVNTVKRLFGDEEIIPRPGRKMAEAIATGKEIAWNRKNVQSVMLQSILQGESIPKIASRVALVTAESNRKVAIRNARTMTTGVQNAGRVDSYKRAEKMGIKVKKQWLATLDSRTRHWHRELDGVSVPVDEKFENDYGEIAYPGDPTAAGANIYNCRCCLIASIDGYEKDLSDLSQRNTNHFEHQSYEKWKEEKESKSNPIDLPEKKAKAMREVYLNEYRYGG